MSKIKKGNKWKCVVCGAKQTLKRVYYEAPDAKDCRKVTQEFNLKRGELAAAPKTGGHSVGGGDHRHWNGQMDGAGDFGAGDEEDGQDEDGGEFRAPPIPQRPATSWGIFLDGIQPPEDDAPSSDPRYTTMQPDKPLVGGRGRKRKTDEEDSGDSVASATPRDNEARQYSQGKKTTNRPPGRHPARATATSTQQHAPLSKPNHQSAGQRSAQSRPPAPISKWKSLMENNSDDEVPADPNSDDDFVLPKGKQTGGQRSGPTKALPAPVTHRLISPLPKPKAPSKWDDFMDEAEEEAEDLEGDEEVPTSFPLTAAPKPVAVTSRNPPSTPLPGPLPVIHRDQSHTASEKLRQFARPQQSVALLPIPVSAGKQPAPDPESSDNNYADVLHENEGDEDEDLEKVLGLEEAYSFT